MKRIQLLAITLFSLNLLLGFKVPENNIQSNESSLTQASYFTPPQDEEYNCVCDTFDLGPGDDIIIFANSNNFTSCGSYPPNHTNSLIAGYDIENQTIVNNSSPKNIPWLDLTNGEVNGSVQRIGSLINWGHRYYIFRKTITPILTEFHKIEFDYIPVIQDNTNFGSWDSQDENIKFRFLGYEAISNNLIPFPSVNTCINYGDPSYQWGQYYYNNWTGYSIDKHLIAGNTYYFDIIVTDCSSGVDAAYLYLDNFCIEEPDLDEQIVYWNIDDDNCDETIITGGIYYDINFDATLNLNLNSFILKIIQNGIVYSSFTYGNPALNITFENPTSQTQGPLVDGYLQKIFTITLDNNITNFPPLDGYDVEVSMSINNNYGYSSTFSDLQIFDGLDNDGDLFCCECGTFTDSYLANSTTNIQFNNNATIQDDIHVGESVTFNFEYECPSSDCDISINEYTTSLTGNLTTSVSGNTMQINYTGNIGDVNSLQYLTIKPNCGPNACSESRTVYFYVGHCECAIEPIIEVIDPTTNIVNYSSTYSNFGLFNTTLCADENLITFSSPCANGCFDCTELTVVDHNFPNLSTYYNPKTKKLEITYFSKLDCNNDIPEDLWLIIKGNCGNIKCNIFKLEFVDCYSNYNSSECLEVFDVKLVESDPGTGIHDVVEFGLINTSPPITSHPYSLTLGLGINMVKFNFENGHLNPNQIFPPAPNGPIPANYPHDYLLDINNNRVYAKLINPYIYQLLNGTVLNPIYQGEEIAYFRIRINPDSLTNGIIINAESYSAYHYPNYNSVYPNNPSFDMLPNVYQENYLDTELRCIPFCKDLSFCVDNSTPIARLSQSNTDSDIDNYTFNINNEYIEVLSSSTIIKTIVIYNSIGQIVYEVSLMLKRKDFYVDINTLNLKTGMYIINVNNKSKEKFMIN